MTRVLWMVLLLQVLLVSNLVLARRNQNRKSCKGFMWRCDNGECIHRDKHCNGEIDCSDGSDETAKRCIHLSCPKYAFRCAYGGCIAGVYKCNGRRDCADNSDETEFLCNTSLAEIDRQLIGLCDKSQEMMQCKSGECIDDKLVCDGVRNCADGSDETVETCSALYCPAYAFRCGYGGCIRGNSKCDGVNDCVDESDEASELCDSAKNNSLVPTTILKPVSGTNPPVAKGCWVPFKHKNLVMEDVNTGTEYRLGETVQSGCVVKFSCENKWKLVGATQNVCVGNKWHNRVPHCTQYCKSSQVSLGISTEAKCYYNGTLLDCSESLRIGTKALVTCAPEYVPLAANDTSRDIITCDQDAEWDFPKPKCYWKCSSTSEQRRIWEVSIFKRTHEPTYRHVCAGAIITPKVVITAARCFTMPNFGSPNEAVYYNIVEGFHITSYTQNDLVDKIAHNVSEIILTTGESPMDIALVVLAKYIRFSSTVKPICLYSNQNENAESKFVNTQHSIDSNHRSAAVQVGSAVDSIYMDGKSMVLTGIVTELHENGYNVTSIVPYKSMIKEAVERYLHLL